MDTSKIHSLLPYLETAKGKFSLQISVANPDLQPSGTVFAPFLLIDDADPFSRVLAGKIISDNGTPVFSVFLQIQKDEYTFTGNALLPVTNQTVTQCWQNTLQSQQKKSDSTDTFKIADQTDTAGNPVPLHSLFFCKKNHTYFHPPCPNCGQLLHLCKDEPLLAAARLEPYNNSLRRYLFCPDCCGKTENIFYSLTRFPDDPPLVADCHQLLAKYKQLLSLNAPDTKLPCWTCSEKETCARNSDFNFPELSIVSFYPFFLLISHAASLGATEYLALLSGAPVQDIEKKLSAKQQTGRIQLLKNLESEFQQNKYFFFKKEKKHFLEILFLKLVFLENFTVNALCSSSFHIFPDIGSALRNTWVDFSSDSLLPDYWSFRCKRFDAGRFIPSAALLPEEPPEALFHSLGLLWFHILTINRTHNTASLYSSLNKMLQNTTPGTAPKFSPFSAEIDPQTFKSKQIFWNPDVISVADEWNAVWLQCLEIGWQFLISARQSVPTISPEEILDRISQVRQNVKNILFTETSAAPSDHAHKDKEKTELTSILNKIEKKWSAVNTIPKTTDPLQNGYTKTQGLNTTPGNNIRAQDNELEETIMVTSETQASPPTFLSTPNTPTVEEDTEETIIITPDKAASYLKNSSIQKHDLSVHPKQDTQPVSDPYDLPETIHGGTSAPHSAERPMHQSPPVSSRITSPQNNTSKTDEDDLAETIIISPKKRQ